MNSGGNVKKESKKKGISTGRRKEKKEKKGKKFSKKKISQEGLRPAPKMGEERMAEVRNGS